MCHICQAFPRSFRSWLFRVCTNRFNTLQRGQRKPGGGSGDSGVQGWLDQQPAPEGEASAWERDCEKQLFDAAARQVRSEFAPSSWAAFVQTSVEGRPAHDVAAELGISVGAVYVAKSRIVARLREKIKELDE